ATGKSGPLQFFHGSLDIGRQYVVTVVIEGSEHRGIAQRVDQAWYASGIPVDDFDAARVENLTALRARDFQAMHDVLPRLFRRECCEVESQPYTLHELRQL